MIARLLLECAVVMLDGVPRGEFDAREGWIIERLGPMHYRVQRLGDEAKNRLAVAAQVFDGYAGTYVEAEPVPENVTPLKRQKGKANAA